MNLLASVEELRLFDHRLAGRTVKEAHLLLRRGTRSIVKFWPRHRIQALDGPRRTEGLGLSTAGQVLTSRWHWLRSGLRLGFLVWAAAPLGYSQELRLDFAPSTTSIRFTLGDILHTFHGSFQLKQGDVEYSLGTRTVHGALVVDATTGQSGNRSRDHKMHREVLESRRYSEIIFRPDRVDPQVGLTGTSVLQVHGVFSIHGVDHELTMPVQLQILPDHWVADAHFAIPYVKWGMKNPSTFFLRVSQSVEIDIHATGQNHPQSGTH